MARQISFWDTRTRKLKRMLPAGDWINASALSRDGNLLAFGGFEGVVHIWDATSAREIHRIPKIDIPDIQLSAVAFAPDNKHIFAAYGEWEQSQATGRIWEIATGALRHTLDVPKGLQERAAYSPDGKIVSAVTTNRGRNDPEMSIRRWDAETGREILRAPIDPTDCKAAFSADGRTLATSASNAPISLWDVETGKRRGAIRNDPGSRCSLAFSPDGHFVASAPKWHADSRRGDERELRIWELASGRLVRSFQIPEYSLAHSLIFSPDGKTLYSGMADTTILAWDAIPTVPRPTADQAAELWLELANDDAGKAHQAEIALTLIPDQAADYLRTKLRPVAADDRANKFIFDLDNDDFAVRENATKALFEVGEPADDALRKALSDTPSFDKRRRIEMILASRTEPITSAALLQTLRAVRVLERIGSPTARQILADLAAGTPSARLTKEAKDALVRLAK
jgi:WD40 repeat protein